MSDRPRISVAAFVQLAAALAVIVAVAATIGALHRSRPAVDLEPVLPAAPDPGSERERHITCQRTLPDELRVTVDAAGDLPDPVGRVLSSEVVECPANFDRHHVEYVGEVVGDVLHRDDGAWVLMNDDAYGLEQGPLPSRREYAGGNTGLAVWLEGELARTVDQPGRYGLRGDVLHVTGVLLRADPADGGGLTLRATSAEVIAEAESARPPLHRAQAVVAGVLVAVAGALALADRFVRRRY